ncbi:FIG01146407: hypothetical protein [hydrothermal vent metagenome]|uniref:Heavy metal RND efflux outer membrane protein, CzcC family n=1 Tax=hydrothermal vent metagenome TaxID=652676 RepID=A0A1W1C5D7_9ZZZZ
MKKYFILCSFVVSLLCADELEDILSDNKALLFDYQFKKNELESNKLSKSWINPVRLQYRQDYSTQFRDKTHRTGTFSVVIDQPIFRSGGIYYAIKYSEALRAANGVEIVRQKRKMIADAVSILFQMKKLKLQEKKRRLLIKNDKIEIHQKKERYDAGLLESSFLDQAILKKSQDEAALLEMELHLLELKQRFTLLSDKNPEKLHLPKLKMMSKREYTKENLDLKRDIRQAEVSKYHEKMIGAKYLPTLALHGQYIDGDSNSHLINPAVREKYYHYGFSVSMPLNVNAFSDIEKSKVEKLSAAIQVSERRETVKEEYQWVVNRLKILEKKIVLAKKDEKIYSDLLRVTKNLVKAGEKRTLDSDMMYHSLMIRKLDQQIYKLDKQIELLKLYMRVENVL